MDPPETAHPNATGRPGNYVWLGLPASLGQIQQPFNLARLRRFVERPVALGASPPIKETLLLTPLWGQHVGDNIDSVSAFHLAEFCVGHDLTFRLPPDYYPPDHADYPFTGPRCVRAFDTIKDAGSPLYLAVYLLDLPIDDSPDGHEFVTGAIPIMTPSHVPASMNWSVLRALKFSCPHAEILKDLLPDADNTVVFQNAQYPIRRVVADRLSKGGSPSRQFLVQFMEEGYEDSAWIKVQFVPHFLWTSLNNSRSQRNHLPPSEIEKPQGTWRV